jgi:hypothetical protein
MVASRNLYEDFYRNLYEDFHRDFYDFYTRRGSWSFYAVHTRPMNTRQQDSRRRNKLRNEIILIRINKLRNKFWLRWYKNRTQIIFIIINDWHIT